MHPHEIVALLHELLMQVGQNAGDLVAEDIEADMLVGIEQGFARDVGQRRAPGEPVVAAAVGQVEMQLRVLVREHGPPIRRKTPTDELASNRRLDVKQASGDKRGRKASIQALAKRPSHLILRDGISLTVQSRD